jgi:hypothetical protein
MPMQVNWPKAPSVPLAKSSTKAAKGGIALDQHGHPAARHPATPGPQMMAPRNDYAELPSGTPTSTPPGGIIGGLAPFQNAKGATNADFQTGPQLKN